MLHSVRWGSAWQAVSRVAFPVVPTSNCQGCRESSSWKAFPTIISTNSSPLCFSTQSPGLPLRSLFSRISSRSCLTFCRYCRVVPGKVLPRAAPVRYFTKLSTSPQLRQHTACPTSRLTSHGGCDSRNPPLPTIHSISSGSCCGTKALRPRLPSQWHLHGEPQNGRAAWPSRIVQPFVKVRCC